MKNSNLYKIAMLCFVLFFLNIPFAPFTAGQDVPATDTMPVGENASAPDEDETVVPLTIKLSVNEIRLDAVVLDRRGNPITDLTAKDFEVFQDNKRMEIKSSVYIDSQSGLNERSTAVRKDMPNVPSSSETALKEEDVRRTILFVVDNYGMTFQNGYYAKMALQNFVEKQMQPGDLISILQTDYGNSALNMFLSDKREALLRINSMPSTMAPRMHDERGPNPILGGLWPHFLATRHENLISTISYGLRALKDMPGRKILIMMTPLSITDTLPQDAATNTFGFSYEKVIREIDEQYDKYYLELADEALRAGVVVNLLDVDGLQHLNSLVYGLDPYNKKEKGINQQTAELIIKNTLSLVRREYTPEINPLPAQTGGITVTNSNFFLEGISREVEGLMKGYYLITYEPPPGTFGESGREDVFRGLKVKVNRSGAAVHTRNGFFGRTESKSSAGAEKRHPLIEAIFSPFQSTDLNVNIAAGYVHDLEAGYLARSWIHLDPKDVIIAETDDGGARIALETLCVTSDINGNIQDSRRAEFSLTITPENKSENIAWIRQHGIRFAMLLPVKKPGAYHIQVSIQDTESGKVGSAYQFLEISDVEKKGLALSNVFMITSADDLNWIRSDVKKELEGGVFLPVFQGDVRSPALRKYASGDQLYTLGMLYNADSKSLSRSEIEMQSVLYKDGVEFRRSETVTVASDGETNPNGIPILQRLAIGPEMPPGDYVLQFLVTDKTNSKKQEGNASQALSFTVVKK